MNAVRLRAGLFVPVRRHFHFAILRDVAAAFKLLPRNPAEICNVQSRDGYSNARRRKAFDDDDEEKGHRSLPLAPNLSDRGLHDG